MVINALLTSLESKMKGGVSFSAARVSCCVELHDIWAVHSCEQVDELC